MQHIELQAVALTICPVACLVQDALFVLLDNQSLETGIVDERAASCRITVLKDKAKVSLCLAQTEAQEITFRLSNEITLVAGNRHRKEKNWNFALIECGGVVAVALKWGLVIRSILEQRCQPKARSWLTCSICCDSVQLNESSCCNNI